MVRQLVDRPVAPWRPQVHVLSRNLEDRPLCSQQNSVEAGLQILERQYQAVVIGRSDQLRHCRRIPPMDGMASHNHRGHPRDAVVAQDCHGFRLRLHVNGLEVDLPRRQQLFQSAAGASTYPLVKPHGIRAFLN